jgi:probable phosphoglycerate mutase
VSPTWTTGTSRLEHRCRDAGLFLSTHPEGLQSGESANDPDYIAVVEQTRLVLIRHGESMAQHRQIVGGHAGCTGLTERGRQECEALRDRILATGELEGASALYSSVMTRAVETAGIIADALSRPEVVNECDFCEHHPGAADGLSWDEADRLYPAPEEWDPDSRRVPGAETWREMSQRVARALDMVSERHRGDTVVVVCHGGVIVHSMIRWLGVTPTAGPGGRARLEPINTSITEWRLTPRAEGGGAVQLVRFNDHAHLSQVGQLL